MSGVEKAAIEAVYDRLFRLAVKIVAKSQHAPMLFRSDRLHVPIPLWNLSKDTWAAMQHAVAHGALGPEVFSIFVCESWVVKRKGPAPDPLPIPSECEDRTDVLLFSFVGVGWQAFAFCDIRGTIPHRTVERAKLTFQNEFDETRGRMVVPRPTEH